MSANIIAASHAAVSIVIANESLSVQVGSHATGAGTGERNTQAKSMFQVSGRSRSPELKR